MGNVDTICQTSTEEFDTSYRDGNEGASPKNQTLSSIECSNQQSTGFSRQAPKKEKLSSTQSTILFLNQDPYQYEWFRLSIAMALLFTLQATAIILSYNVAFRSSAVNIFELPKLGFCAAMLVACLVVWMACVVVTDTLAFSNKRNGPLEISKNRSRRTSTWKRVALYLVYVLLLFGGSCIFLLFTMVGLAYATY